VLIGQRISHRLSLGEVLSEVVLDYGGATSIVQDIEIEHFFFAHVFVRSKLPSTLSTPCLTKYFDMICRIVLPMAGLL
jgi:hypothetical protein